MNFKLRGKVNTKPLKEAKSDDEDFENYDMFVFITNLFTRDHKEIYKRPLNPLGRPHKHFDYVPKDEDRSAPSPVSATPEGNILITTVKKEDFADVEAICDKYQFDCSIKPNGKYWTCEIEVPSYSPGYPMLVEDYFEDLGMSVDDVMPSWYSKQMAKAGVGVNESIGNLKRIIDEKSIDPVAALGATMADAYKYSEKADKEVEDRMNKYKKETGIDYSKPFTGTAKSGETKKVSTPSLKKMHLSESLFEDVKPDEATIKADLQTALRKKGLKLNPNECSIDDAVENIMMSNGELTVDEWIKETQRNYPECFEESLTEGRYGLAPKYTMDEANRRRDEFISMVEEGAIDAVEALKSLCYWLTADEVSDFIDANGFLPEDDLYEGCRKSKGKKSLKEDSEQDEINAFTDEYWDKYDSICRYLDVEIPDKCGEVHDYVNTAAGEQMSMNSLDYILGKCRRFYDDLEYVLK